MSIVTSTQAEQDAVLSAAKLIMAAITTSPKTRGLSTVSSALIYGEEKERLAAAMERKHAQKKSPLDSYPRDAQNVRRSAAVLLIGIRGTVPKRPERPLNCGACGNMTCAEFIRSEKKTGEDYKGPLCAFEVVDLGIACGVAAKMAAELNLDNRLMYTAGAAAMSLGYLDAEMIVALPLSVSPKNIYFDRH
ncbi:MAG TPA: DUF2148 domain-containing protein [Thermodesulfobacteriota bacterium]|nr:DUF2148 domain-containing protein [Thermodesulfobacteriota bacterium]